MKKFLLLPLLAAMFVSCSADNDTVLLEEDAVVFTTVEPAKKLTKSDATVSCISSVKGNVTVDVSDGLNYPKVVFIADVPNSRTTTSSTPRFSVHLEIQLIADCEDLESGTGIISKFSLNNVAVPAITDPSITLLPSQLPSSCYRWRYVVDGVKTLNGVVAFCSTASPWYYEPVY